VDVLASLVLPFSGFLAFMMVLWCAVIKCHAPRLIWPFAFSTLVAALVVVGLPAASTALIWVFFLAAMASQAAIGTVIGAAAARLAMAVFRKMKRKPT
jgi:hypothetical protein